MTHAAFEPPARIARMRAQNVAPGPHRCHPRDQRGLLPIAEILT